MARVTHLIDNSAFMRAVRLTEVQKVVDPLVAAGRIGRCSVFEMEALWSTRPQEFQAACRQLEAFSLVATHQADWDRATYVMGRLAESGRHRSAAIPDLLIAAVAERTGLTVLHYDRDFEVIASVTGQHVEAVVPLGSVT